nr:YHS domain-containing (seleno)protein [Hwanghaeella grinnelliae]
MIGVSLFASAPAQAAEDPVFQSFLGTAINGYDPVAYFTEDKPVEGSSDHAYHWNGAEWHFASAENLETFKADPEKYAPQYGGYCAYAVSEGYTAKTEPDAWKIVDGKLYLNYNKDVQEKWAQDISGRIANADKNWPKVLE